MRRLFVLAAAAVAVSVLLLAGCSSSTPAPPTPSTSASGGSAASALSSTSPSASPTPSATNSEFGAFGSRDALISTCITLDKEKVGSEYLTIQTEQARVERRVVAPEWLVYIPATNENGDVAIHCIFGGSPDDIEFMTVGGVLPFSEDDIQRDIASNDNYTY